MVLDFNIDEFLGFHKWFPNATKTRLRDREIEGVSWKLQSGAWMITEDE